MKMNSHLSLNTPIQHLNRFYNTFDELKHRKFDGLIITGAPVEQIPFEEVAGNITIFYSSITFNPDLIFRFLFPKTAYKLILRDNGNPQFLCLSVFGRRGLRVIIDKIIGFGGNASCY